MQYRDFGKTGCKVSVLGFGCMRFPQTNKDDSSAVDEAKAISMVRSAIDSGINYIDTAYFYHDGVSELVVGKSLKNGYRDKVYLATKLPMGEVKCADDFDRLLNDQLKKLNTDHIDFYLFHALNRDSWKKVVDFNLLDKMQRAKQEGKIRHCGFSFHDDLEVFTEIIDNYTGCEFCQIQLNYLDADYQAGIEGLKYAAAKGLGVVIMEPLRGGYLANPPKEIKDCFAEDTNAVDAALNFVWNRPEVSVVLSGMSSESQVAHNLKLADCAKAEVLSSETLMQYKKAKEKYNAMQLIPCTGCMYCQPCKHGVEIPEIFAAFNLIKNGDRRTVKEKMPDIEYRIEKCQKCGECEKKCPQNIKIISELRRISDSF